MSENTKQIFIGERFDIVLGGIPGKNAPVLEDTFAEGVLTPIDPEGPHAWALHGDDVPFESGFEITDADAIATVQRLAAEFNPEAGVFLAVFDGWTRTFQIV